MDDPKFKVLALQDIDEFSDDGNKAPLSPFVRQYVGSLGTIHENLRKIIHPKLHHSSQLIKKHIADSADKFKQDTFSLAAVQIDELGHYVKTEYLNDRLITRRIQLEKKNSSLSSISKRYVISR